MDAATLAFSPERKTAREFVRVLKRISMRLGRLGKARHGGDPAEAIHEIRTLLKLLRALLWFAKPALPPTTGAYAKLELQKAARLLSGPRDVTAMTATLEAAGQEASPAERLAVQRARDLLAAAAPEAEDALHPGGPEAQAVALTRKTIRLLIHDASGELKWKSPRRRLERAHARTDRARKAAQDDPTPAHLHEWRKKAKRLLYR